MRIVEYNVVEVNNPDDLMKEVNTYIKNGYQPYGDPHIVYTPEPYDSWNYTQVMVKYEEDKVHIYPETGTPRPKPNITNVINKGL